MKLVPELKRVGLSVGSMFFMVLLGSVRTAVPPSHVRISNMGKMKEFAMDIAEAEDAIHHYIRGRLNFEIWPFLECICIEETDMLIFFWR